VSRFIKTVIAAGAAFGLALLLCAGALFVLSGGQPVNFVQTEFIRWQLASRQDDLNRPIGTDAAPVRFTVAPGDSPRVVAQRLLDSGLIADAGLFVDYVRVSGLDVALEAGTYFLNQTQTIPQIAVTLTDSRSSVIPFRILEGWRLEEIAAAVDANHLFAFSGADFLAVVGPGADVDPTFAQYASLPPGASLEGFLFPDTYQLPPDITATGLRDTLLATFSERVDAQLVADASAQGLSLFEVVTLASIVQRESVHPEENPKIAGVYRNRLDIAMKLDADPTVQYGIGYKDGAWWPQITQDDYTNAVHPYNTYLQAGLPPGPIANPGLSAIRAVVFPVASDYLYFRAACDGSGFHNFARTFADHVANGCP
jgi:UPF0755 protein